MANFVIDLQSLWRILKHEGPCDFPINPFRSFKEGEAIMKEWTAIVGSLDGIVRELAVNGASKSMRPMLLLAMSHVKNLQKLLAPMALEGGSFIPGPIGIICSFILAIQCFCIGNVPGGILNLIGCIPCAKSCTKLGPQFIKVLESNPAIKKFSSQITGDTYKFLDKRINKQDVAKFVKSIAKENEIQTGIYYMSKVKQNFLH